MITRRGLGTLAAIPLSAPALAQSRDLTVVSWGGAYQDAQRDVFFRPWMQRAGQRMLEETWDGGIAALRAKIASNANNWDVVQVESEELLLGAAEGLFEQLDWSAIGGRDHYVEAAVHESGVGAILYSFVIAFDRARGTSPPANWADFFDLRRIPGKRALRRGPKTTLEIALLADGVPAREIYARLATEAGQDQAFRKLDSIKPDLVWWERGAQPAQLLAAGEAALSIAYNGRIDAANRNDGRNLGIVWTNNLFALDSWVIMRGSPNRARALDFLRFAGEPQVQAGLPPRIPYGVTARAANRHIPAAVLANLPTAPQNAADALPINDRFWLDNLDRLNQRFHSWLA
jgi:putative spermidine/putrescine transport system substrate-binding protein